jgi:hypothetical protein
LDNTEVEENQLLAVTADSSVTIIGSISAVGRSALRDHLYTAGELLRLSQIEPDEPSKDLRAEQLDLFTPLLE